jgi:GntR family transcriptional repressor for pyruvate dehydrogenase complex
LVRLLRQGIVSGDYAVGARLPSERVLAERNGVARSVVREALRSLAEQGLVSIEVGRGAYVTAPSVDAAAPMLDSVLRRNRVSARQVISARRLIEGENAALAAAGRTEAGLAEMRRALEDFEQAATLLDQVEADLALHTAIARASGNPVLDAMFGAIRGFTAEIMLRSLGDQAVSQRALPQHETIIDAISRRQAKRARQLMTEHIDVAQRLYGDDLDRPLAQVVRGRLLTLTRQSPTAS